MKTSVLILESALVLGLCLGAGCATRHGIKVQDPAYAAPVGASAPSNSPAVGREPSRLAATSGKPVVTEPPTTPVVVTEAPPPPHVEVVRSAPGPQYVWIPGYWEWKDRWSWVNGHWVVSPYANAAWIPGRWIRRANGGWSWVRGYWR
jgi:hypothetical protein